jgi:hypothetical protein
VEILIIMSGFGASAVATDVLNPVKQVRSSCQKVVDQASHVRINDAKMNEYVDQLMEINLSEFRNGVEWDASGWHYSADATSGGPLTCQYVFVVDCLNFCFWPQSGLEYDTLALSIKGALEQDANALSGAALACMTEATLRSWFPATLQMPNFEERIIRIRELGQILVAEFDGQAINLVRAAKGSAVRLVTLVLRYLPGFRDTSIYRGNLVHLYKRAQILVGDLWAAYGRPVGQEEGGLESESSEGRSLEGKHLFCFRDIGELTMFADYRVPQILRAMKILEYSSSLAQKVDNMVEIVSASEEEVELRAATVIAVDMLQKKLEGRGVNVLVIELDWLLWQIGERTKDTLAPHHRTLTIYY